MKIEGNLVVSHQLGEIQRTEGRGRYKAERKIFKVWHRKKIFEASSSSVGNLSRKLDQDL